MIQRRSELQLPMRELCTSECLTVSSDKAVEEGMHPQTVAAFYLVDPSDGQVGRSIDSHEPLHGESRAKTPFTEAAREMAENKGVTRHAVVGWWCRR